VITPSAMLLTESVVSGDHDERLLISNTRGSASEALLQLGTAFSRSPVSADQHAVFKSGGREGDVFYLGP
jgi:hypothetical protein